MAPDPPASSKWNSLRPGDMAPPPPPPRAPGQGPKTLFGLPTPPKTRPSAGAAVSELELPAEEAEEVEVDEEVEVEVDEVFDILDPEDDDDGDLASVGTSAELFGDLAPVGAASKPQAPRAEPELDVDEAIDLPVPVTGRRGAPPAPPGVAPVGANAGPQRVVPDSESSGETDLPTPVGGRDLPAPVVEADLPTPVGETDLPTPVHDLDDLDADLDAALELPLPDDERLPTPAPGQSEAQAVPLASLRPGEATPVAVEGPAQLLEAEPEPGALEVDIPEAEAGEPTLDALELDLEADLEAEAEPEAQVDAGTTALAVTEDEEDEEDEDSEPGPGESHHPDPALLFQRRGSPAPRKVPLSTAVKKALLYGSIGAVLLASVGGVYMAGLFDFVLQPEPEAKVQRAAPKVAIDPPAPKAEEPKTVLAEPADAILAKLDLDTPAGYQEAIALAEAAKNPLAQVEATLLLHHRYGPDPVLLGQAEGMSSGKIGGTDPFTHRVVGLHALVSGNLETAAKRLGGDNIRTKLYRSWVLAEQGKTEEARSLAQSLVDEAPGNNAAVLTAREAEVGLDPSTGLDALRQSANDHADHPGHVVALIFALSEHGMWGEAERRAAELELGKAASVDYQATLLGERAKIARRQGKLQLALGLIEEAKKMSAQSESVAVERIRINLARKNYNAVDAELEALQKAFPKSFNAQLLAAEIGLAKGEGQDALAAVKAAIALDGKDPRPEHLRGKVFALRKDYAKARTAFAAARNSDPGFAQATVDEAIMLRDTTKPEEAMTLVDEQHNALANIADSRGKRARALLLRTKAQFLARDNRSDEALVVIEQSLGEYPFDNQARLQRGEVHLALGKRDLADTDLLEVYTRTGGYPGLAVPLGRVYLRRAEYSKLQDLIGDGLGEEDAPVDELLVGARLRLHQQRFVEADALADRALFLDGLSWEAHLVKGKTLLAKGSYGEALDELKQVRAPAPSAELALALGKAHAYNGQPKVGLTHYLQAMRLDPELLEAAALYGRALAFSGAAKQAIRVLDPVVKQTDQFAYAYLALGRAHNDLGRKDTAVRQLQQAYRLDPRLFDAYYWEARIYGDANRHSEVARTLSKGLKQARPSEPNRPEGYRLLGRAYEALGKPAAAREAYKTYLKIAPEGATGRVTVERALSLIELRSRGG